MKLALKELWLEPRCELGAGREPASLVARLPLIVADKHAALSAKAIYLKLPVNFGGC